MEHSSSVDWFAFSFPSDIRLQNLSLHILADHYGERVQSSRGRFHGQVYRWPGVILSLDPLTKNSKPMIEFTGEGCQEWGEEVWDLLGWLGGKVNRVDYCWDFWSDGICDGAFREVALDIKSWETQRAGTYLAPKTYKGLWSGWTYGYGKGSEISIRAYRKDWEQGEKWDGDEWWRIEVTIRGNTCKIQKMERSTVQGLALGTFHSRIKARYPVGISLDMIPRCSVKPKVESTLLYWQRMAKKSLEKVKVYEQI